METYMTASHEWEFRNYIAPLTIYPIHYYIHKYPSNKSIEIVYNKYISKSLINVHSRKIMRYSDNQYEGLIYLFLYTLGVLKKKDEKIIELLRLMNKTVVQRFCKTFEHFYNVKINPKILV